MPLYIYWLKKVKANQFLREEGPKSHAVKANTPTTGGICFIVVTLIALLFAPAFDHYSNWVAFLCFAGAVCCGLVGLADDIAKIKNKANKGISAKSRLSSEAALGFAFGLVAFICLPLFHLPTPYLLIPHALFEPFGRFVEFLTQMGPVEPHFGKLIGLELPFFFFILLSVAIFTATTNAVNLHDGMDGLASGTAILVLLTMALMLLSVKSDNRALVMLAVVAAGALASFLVYNRYPAKIFMGDTGSLYIGGLLAAIALCGGLAFWFIPLGAIYIAEALSVMAQVSYFRLTKPYEPPLPISSIRLFWMKLTQTLPGQGKRLFRMAPIHHHFEAVLAEKGWREWQVVLAFWVAQLLLCVCTLAAFYTL